MQTELQFYLLAIIGKSLIFNIMMGKKSRIRRIVCHSKAFVSSVIKFHNLTRGGG